MPVISTFTVVTTFAQSSLDLTPSAQRVTFMADRFEEGEDGSLNLYDGVPRLIAVFTPGSWLAVWEDAHFLADESLWGTGIEVTEDDAT